MSKATKRWAALRMTDEAKAKHGVVNHGKPILTNPNNVEYKQESILFCDLKINGYFVRKISCCPYRGYNEELIDEFGKNKTIEMEIIKITGECIQ